MDYLLANDACSNEQSISRTQSLHEVMGDINEWLGNRGERFAACRNVQNAHCPPLPSPAPSVSVTREEEGDGYLCFVWVLTSISQGRVVGDFGTALSVAPNVG